MGDFGSNLLYASLVLNGMVAAITFAAAPYVYPDAIWVCYVVAITTTMCACGTLIAFFVGVFGPRRALIGLFGQGAAIVICFAGMYHAIGLLSDGRLINTSGWTSIYFSVVTWTTLGYGDYAPASQLQIIAAMQAGLGLIFFGLLVGIAANWVNRQIGD